MLEANTHRVTLWLLAAREEWTQVTPLESSCSRSAVCRCLLPFPLCWGAGWGWEQSGDRAAAHKMALFEVGKKSFLLPWAELPNVGQIGIYFRPRTKTDILFLKLFFVGPWLYKMLSGSDICALWAAGWAILVLWKGTSSLLCRKKLKSSSYEHKMRGSELCSRELVEMGGWGHRRAALQEDAGWYMDSATGTVWIPTGLALTSHVRSFTSLQFT